ncbi:hypothetical protein PoB_005798900 [Plakobranchus ocellatus]|uniref:Uncharacterized protein n=1 Tax=Plakobranchus ocellatus TaxID=259542 RepID=A0AAV4CKM7_9GAST|nr:hypothetical protein PoB_005798900 [Plakobranchus ocellatus]
METSDANGRTTWSASAKTKLQNLDHVQNQALWIITGEMKSTSIKELEKLEGVSPLVQRREAKIFTQAGKIRSLPDQPMKGKVERDTEKRLKRSTLVEEIKTPIRQCKNTAS